MKAAALPDACNNRLSRFARFGIAPETAGLRVDGSYSWSIMVCAKNEARNLPACLLSVAEAIQGHDAHVSVLVNGTTDRSVAAAIRTAKQAGLNASVFTIGYGDKSNVWNQFLYRLRPEASNYIFMDSYVRVARESLARLVACSDNNTMLNMISGRPVGSRSADAWCETMFREDGISGNLYIASSRLLETITRQTFLLPVGLYRGDGLLNSFARHEGDALNTDWNKSLALVLPEAHFYPLRWSWSVREVNRRWQRYIRQGRGRLENAAIKSIIYHSGYQGLPAFASQMIAKWVACDPSRIPDIRKDPFAHYAWRLARQDVFPPAETLWPQLIERISGQ